MGLFCKFCCCFDLRTGAIFSGFYVLGISLVFMMKHAVWLRLLLVGEVQDWLEPFLDTLLRERNDSWNPTALNLTSGIHRRNLASHTLHLLWSSGGVVTSSILLFAIFKHLPLLFLPWLSWCSVNCIILLVNAIVDIIIWSYFGLYSSMNVFTVYAYANLPFMVYLILVTGSYYQAMELIYDENQLNCWSGCMGGASSDPERPLCPSDGRSYGTTENETGQVVEMKSTWLRRCKRRSGKPPRIKVSQASTDEDW